MGGSTGSTKGGRGKPKSSKSVSRTQKAGLQFPVGRIASFLNAGKYADRVGARAPVYLSTVLEYLAVEGLELAGNATRDYKKNRIVPRHIHQNLLPKSMGKGKGDIGSGSNVGIYKELMSHFIYNDL